MGTSVQVFVRNASKMTVLTLSGNLVALTLCYNVILQCVVFKAALETDAKAAFLMRVRNREAQQEALWNR